MKFFLFIFLSLLSFESIAGKFCKNQRNLTHSEQLASLGPNFDLKLLNLELFPSGDAFFKYEYDIAPAYTKGLYKRSDKWLLGTKLDITHGSDVSTMIDTHVEASFIRFKKNPCEAMLSNPYTPLNMPLKAKVAIGNDFKIGDYFFFRGSAGFSVGSDILNIIGHSTMGVTLSGNYLVQGFYQLHIVRLDQNHIRLKILGHKGNTISGKIGLGFNDEIEIFKWDQINNSLEKLVNLNPVKFSLNKTSSNVLMVDYVLDLTNPEVVSVFESMIKSAKDFKNIKLTGMFKQDQPLENNLILDVSGFEKLYKRDVESNSVSRIKRNLKTNSKQKMISFNFDLGNRIIGYESKKDRAISNLGVERPNGVFDNYVLRSWDFDSNGQVFFDFNKSSKEENLRALFHANKEFEIESPINIVKSITLKESRFRFSEYLELKLMIKKLVPNEIYQEISWGNWNQTKGRIFSNFGLRFNLIMSPDSIKEAPQLSIESIKSLFREHMATKGLTESDYVLERLELDKSSLHQGSVFDVRLHHMAKYLSKLLDKHKSLEERLNYLTNLQRNSLFTQSGLSFIMSLNPGSMSRLYHLDLNLSSNESAIDYSFGESELSDLYKKLLSVKAALDDDAFDLLREAESLSDEVILP